MYTTKRYQATIPVSDYLREYVDIPTFLECCKKCHNYETKWSCPCYDFDVLEYWQKYRVFDLTAIKIIFDKDYAGISRRRIAAHYGSFCSPDKARAL